jgi:hypothetical protein
MHNFPSINIDLYAATRLLFVFNNKLQCTSEICAAIALACSTPCTSPQVRLCSF